MQYTSYAYAGNMSCLDTTLLHQVPITVGYAEALWNEKFAWHF